MPIPLPGDLVVFAVGERVAAGACPLLAGLTVTDLPAPAPLIM